MAGKKSRASKAQTLVSGAATRAAVARHKKVERALHARTRRTGMMPSNLVAREAVPKSKHKTYYELADNSDKKTKKLEFEVWLLPLLTTVAKVA